MKTVLLITDIKQHVSGKKTAVGSVYVGEYNEATHTMVPIEKCVCRDAAEMYATWCAIDVAGFVEAPLVVREGDSYVTYKTIPAAVITGVTLDKALDGLIAMVRDCAVDMYIDDNEDTQDAYNWAVSTLKTAIQDGCFE